MARIEENELIYWLGHQDPEALLLVVEGNTDLRFWSLIAPLSQRSRTVIYPIDRIEVVGAPLSARGRALCLADRIRQSCISQRVMFFLDADADRILGRDCPINVILTDYRDLEAYAFHADAMRSVLFSFGFDPDNADRVLAVLGRIVRPCGLVRLMDEIESLSLPFQEAWCDRLKRQIDGEKNEPRIHSSDLIRRLLQRAGISLVRLAWAEECYANVTADFAATPTLELTHGKDLVSAVSWHFDVTYAEAGRAILAALAESRQRISRLPQLQLAYEFALR